MEEKKDKSIGIGKTILCTLVCFISFWAALSAYWGVSRFANLTLDEMVYELSAPLTGTGGGLLDSYAKWCVAPAVALAVVVFIVLMLVRKGKAGKFMHRLSVICAVLLFAVSAVYFAKYVNMTEFVISRTTESTFIDDNYVDPSDVEVDFPEEKRNLVFIYLESMETTYADKENGGDFGENLIPELTTLAQENEDFSGSDKKLNGGYSMPGTTWTMGAMYGITSGLPLRSALSDNSMEKQKSFFPNIVTLGDMLGDEGYKQVFMCGSDIVFGGREVYLKDHGNYEIIDWPRAKELGLIPEDYKVYWGYEDRKLFEFAKDEATQLASEGQPFDLMLLTVDTHMPKGYQCELCTDEHDLPYANSLSCSSRQATEFVKWLQEQDFYDNTTIVITGDHPTMAQKICDDVDADYVRRTYTCIINPDPTAVEGFDASKNRMYSTFDLFPTTIAALGAKIEGERLGLGTNLYSGKETLSEEVGYAKEAEEVSKNSKKLDELEQFDEKTTEAIEKFANVPPSEISVNAKRKKLYVKTPDLSEYDDEIFKVMIKVWCYDGQEYLKSTKQLERNDDGTWSGSMNIEKFMDMDTVKYQMYVGVNDVGTINLSEEGNLTIEK